MASLLFYHILLRRLRRSRRLRHGSVLPPPAREAAENLARAANILVRAAEILAPTDEI